MTDPTRPRLPWVTHLVAAALLMFWLVAGTGSQYGYYVDEGWWWPWPDYDAFIWNILLFLALVVAPAAAAFEALAVVRRHRAIARVVALTYMLPICWFTALPLVFRLVGDTSHADARDAAMFVQVFTLLVLVQLGWAELGRRTLLRIDRTPPSPATAGTTPSAAPPLTQQTGQTQPTGQPPSRIATAMHRAHERLYHPTRH